MKKTITLILAFATALALCFSIAACSEPEDSSTYNEADDNRAIIIITSPSSDANTPIDKSNINIFYEGGTSNNDIIIDESTKFSDIIKSVPVKDGFAFAGWYSDSTYRNYIDPYDITVPQFQAGTAYAKWIKIETKSYNVRSSEATITDSGRKKQKMDLVEISSDYAILDLQRAGYTKLSVTVTATVREIDDGYQYIFLYSNTNCTGNDIGSVLDFYDKYVFGEDSQDPSLLYMHKFEHGAGDKDTSWETVSFTVSLDLDLLSRDLYIRYGASGKNDDDWMNKNIKVSITPLK